jgi:hypothetical protein
MTTRLLLYIFTALVLCAGTGSGQTAETPAKTSPGATAQSGQEPAPSSPGFSIETEMFTYKAVEQNSALIACDVARYLYGSSVSDAPPDAHVPCAIRNATQAPVGIVIVSSNSTLLSDFQVWRADMATMNDLEARAHKVCVIPSSSGGAANPNPQGENAGQTPQGGAVPRGATVPLGFTGFTPAGQAASLIGDSLRMINSSESVSSVGGTVHDPAFMNEVARQLRSLNVLILMPEIYSPNSLDRADYAGSLYFKSLESLSDSYSQCETAKAAYPTSSPQAAEISTVIYGMDSFLKMAVPTSPAPGLSQSSPNSNGGAQVPTSTLSHFAAVFAADDVARQLGFGPDGGGPSDTWQHVLWLKALESGGSVAKETNILRTKVQFSGGAVDTFAVFRLDGELVCSGNVYDFQSPVLVKNLEKSFRADSVTSPANSPELRSTCSMLPPAPPPHAN